MERHFQAMISELYYSMTPLNSIKQLMVIESDGTFHSMERIKKIQYNALQKSIINKTITKMESNIVNKVKSGMKQVEKFGIYEEEIMIICKAVGVNYV